VDFQIMDKPKILIIEDDDFVRNQMKWALAAQYEVLLAEDRSSALEIFKAQSPAAVTLDLGLPPSPDDTTEGFRALSDMLHIDPLMKVFIISGQDETENALAAIGQGAYDFFCKPVDVEALKIVISRAIRVCQFERQNRELNSVADFQFEGMLGACHKMHLVFQDIRKVAVSNAPVLIAGESGTGKELAARAIHNLSPRKNGPFIAINCGAIPETLLESELFGHEKGAFTGAHAQRSGRLEMAQGGTLFLDEIGETSLAIQVKLLRFLQDHVIERVGGRKSITVDARVICATNSDLRESMAKGEFREDLYYRIGVLAITMPPLRERNGDITLLANAILQKYAAEHNKNLTFSSKTLDAMGVYSWPGNVRELENQLKRAVVMAEGKQITPRDLELNGKYAEYRGMGLNEVREAIERDLIEQAIARNRGNLTRCAEELKISRSTLYELVAKLQIARK
jgi:two-component system NtrC family response regulator